MGSEGHRRALLLGLVEVLQPLDQLDEDGQTRMFALCHTASIAGHVDDTDWLGWQERGFMGVEVALDQDHLQVTSNEVLVSRHSLAEVSAIATLQDTEGHLVVVGHCQVKGHPLAVVLDMMSQDDARQLEEEVNLRLSRRLLRPSVPSSASQDTTTEIVPGALPLTDLDPSTSPSDTRDKSVSQHNYQATVHTPASSGPTGARPPSSMVQSSPFSSDVSNQPSPSSKKISPAIQQLKPPAANMPAKGTFLATPLRCAFHPPVSRVTHAQVSVPTMSKTLVSDAPVSTLPVATPLVSTGPVSTLPVTTRPLSTPSAPAPAVSNPSLFYRSVSIHPVSSSQASTPLVSSSQSSTPVTSTSLVSTPPVSTHSVTLRPVSIRSLPTRPVSSPPVSSSPASSRPASTITAPVSPVPTRPLFKPALPTKPGSASTVSPRPVPPSKTFTPLVAILPVSTVSASNPLVSSSSVSTPRFPTQHMSLQRVVTPLVFASTESNKTFPSPPVCTLLVSTRPPPTRPPSKPVVPTRPLSFPKISSPVSNTAASNTAAYNTAASTSAASYTTASNTAASISAASNTAASNTAASSTAASNTAVFTTPDNITSLFTTLVSTTAVSATTVPSTPVSSSPMPALPETTVSASTLPTSSPAVFKVAADPQLHRRPSIASSSSLEEDNSSGSEKVELILGTLNVDESEYLFTPGMKHTQEQDSSSSLEHELSVLLENEHQYLDILQRIKDARSVVKSELQNLLRRNERLADFHRDLFQDLHQEFPSCSGVVRVFLSRKEDLEQYRYYLMNAPLVLRQLGQQTEEVICQHPTLEADLKSTWKRLHYYFMTFDKISKAVPAEEQPLVQELVDLLRNMNRQGDSAILIDGVSGAPFSLHTLGSLLLHGLFTIKDSTGVLKPKSKHHVLLFEEMMIITLPKKESYQYKDHLPIRQLNLRQANGDEATFVLDFVQGGNKKNRRFTFKSRQQESKDAWVNELTRLHLEYAKEVKRLSKLRYGWQ